VYPDDTDGVTGEVWSVDAPCLARLDLLEGINEGLYRRSRIALQPPFAETEVETYFYLLGTDGRPPITGGAWNDTTT
jgi:gamma-glutamylcyclotransferase (GGCT)/AIG2-like uncharacterized protein YtfP